MRPRLFVALLAALLPGLAGFATAGASEEALSDYDTMIDLTFPISGPVQYSDTYSANRGGGNRRHQATDLMADKLTYAHAAVDGVVCRITGIDEPMPSWGYQIVICGDDGREYGYVHLNNDNPGTDDGLGGPELAYAPGIAKDVRVARGQWVGYVGDSGNAENTAPHLHFSIYDPNLIDPRLAADPWQQGYLNPFPSLQAAWDRGDIPTPEGTAPPERAPDPAPVRRLSGATRIDTAVALSGDREAAQTVIIAPQGSHAEALVAAPLAGLTQAPVLLASDTGLSQVVAAEVARLGAANAYIVGREDQLPALVESQLRAAGVTNLARLDGPDAFALSAAVAREIASFADAGGTTEAAGAPQVLLALGESEVESRAWPDALSAGALAAHTHTPILLTAGDTLPAPVAALLAEARPTTVTVVGGDGAITAEVAQAAAAAAGGAAVNRLSGRTRYETSVAVAEAGIAAGLDAPSVWMATGRNYPDALAAGPAAARSGAPLLLLDGLGLDGSPPALAWLDSAGGLLESATVVGGTGVITDGVATDVGLLLAR